MWGESFHKLCGFQGIHTRVIWDRRWGKKTPWEWTLWGGVTEWRKPWSCVQCPKKHKATTQYKLVQLLHIMILLQGQGFPQCSGACTSIQYMHRYTHKHMDIQWMLTATAPCVPSVLRGNLRNGTMRNFRYLKQSFTFLLVKEFKLLLFCESIQHLRLIHQLTLHVCYPESVVQLN